MKTVFKHHSEVCHVWAQQKQSEGTAGNISFRNNFIYSYHWWIMAKFINDNTVLMRNWPYSSATSRHLSHVASAIPDYVNIIYCYDPGNIDDSVNDFVNTIKESYNTFEKKRNKVYAYQENTNAYSDLEKLCKVMDRNIPDITHYLIGNESVYVRMIEEEEKRAEELQEKREQKERERQAKIQEFLQSDKARQLQDNWRNGEGDYSAYYNHSELGTIRLFNYPALRLKDNQVQTSMGATVDVRPAKILLHKIRNGEDIKGFQLNYYTVIGMNGALKIGCHEIPREEIEMFAAINNW